MSRSLTYHYSTEPAEYGATGNQDDLLMDIAKKLRLHVFDLEEGIFGFITNDYKFGIEVVRTVVDIEPSIGLELTEMAAGSDGRGLVLVSGVNGNAAKCQPPIHVGDVVTGVSVGEKWKEKTIEFNYDQTVETIEQAKQEAEKHKSSQIFLELNRVVPRSKIQVQVVSGDTGNIVQTVEGLAGENLRLLLMRQGIKVYDSRTKRFDLPYATGDCGGEGMCGTCLVAVLENENDILTPKDSIEHLITKKRPESWRASCRTVVGVDNKSGTIRIQTCPQSALSDELDPGVRSVEFEEN